jgi:alkylation response protein AidB-like acyl-CoA dehydrogenase
MTANLAVQPAALDPGTDLPRFREQLRVWLRQHSDVLARWRDAHPATMEDTLQHEAQLMRLLWDSGWGRWGWPETVGGTGGQASFRAVMLDELWAHDVEVPHQYDALEVMAPLLADVRPDLAAEFLPAFASGQECWVQAFSEPEAGSDIAALRTRARPATSNGGFVLTGQKTWGSYGVGSNRAFVLARTGSPDSRHRGLTMFFVDLDSPGVTVRPIALASGVNHLAETFFDDVRVPDARVIGEVDGGWAVLMQLLQYERGSYAWQRQAKLLRRLRGVVARFPGEYSAAAGDVGRAYLQVLAVRAQAARTVRRLAAGETVGPETSVDKVLLGPAEHAVADLVRDVDPHEFLLGDSAKVTQLHDDWWFSRATTIFGGAAEVQRGIVADRVLRLPSEKG